jgi:hypothetical protein
VRARCGQKHLFRLTFLATAVLAKIDSGVASAQVAASTSPEAASDEPTPAASAAIVLPTVTPVGEPGSATTGVRATLRRPTEKDGPLVDRAREIDAILAEAAQDLGLSLDVGRRGAEAAQARDVDVAESAVGLSAWVFSPRIERDGSELLVRIVAVAPGSRVVMVRSERVSVERMPVRLVVMLRDLVRANPGKTPPEATRETDSDAPPPPRAHVRSDGRAVLGLSAAAYGGFLGYALQRAGGGDDPRLLYPLIALGTGVGIGASMIVADEWDVSTADASYVGAGTVWPSLGAYALAHGYGAGEADRYGYALAGGAVGLGLSALSAGIARRPLTDGQATFTHSGAGFGLFLGASTEFLARGSTKNTPFRGVGYGTLAGTLVAGALASRVPASSGRVLTTDLGAVLGGLLGAAAGSPLLLGDPTPGRERAWVGLSVAGAVAGAGAAIFFTQPRKKTGKSADASASDDTEARRPLPRTLRLIRPFVPTPSVVAVSEVRGRTPVPAMGLAWYGTFR